jgi:hypothetical protein
VAVTLVDGSHLDFEFSAAVTCDGNGASNPWVEMPVFGPEAPLGSEQVSPTVVRFWYGDDQLADGVAWHVDAAPECLSFGTATLEVPESCTVGE